MIRPLALSGTSVWLHHDQEQVGEQVVGGHHGVVEIRDLCYANTDTGQCDPTRVTLPCPDTDCPWVSTHPVGGGGLTEDDTRRLQQIFVAKLVADGWHPDEAEARVSDLIEATDGAHRNLLGAPATSLPEEELSMPETPPVPTPALVAPDLGDAIVEQIDRTLDRPFPSTASPLLVELLDYLDASRRALAQRTAALQRIRETLLAARALRDADVTRA